MGSEVALAHTLETVPEGIPDDIPGDDPAAYRQRIQRLRTELRRRNLTHASVYGDREHSANLQYLVGFDPRFEEALLLVGEGTHAALLVGNEGKAYAAGVTVDLETVNVREFSLPGQPWHDAVPLDRAIEEFGLDGGAVGVVGWKHFDDDGGQRFDVPSYVVESLREAIGASGRLHNATGLLSRAPGGIRTRSGALEIAQFEFSARLSSACVRRGLAAVAPGVREIDVAAAIAPPALPLTMHPIVTTGERVDLGIASASDRLIQHGDPVMMAIGFRGALVARAGMLLTAAESRSGAGRRYLDALAGPYLEALSAWYEGLRLSVTGGELHAAVVERIDGRFELALNPGHLIHLEEWLDAPVRPGSTVALDSGMALQCDIIPVSPEPGMAINAEDTVVLADVALREELQRSHPGLCRRVSRRREAIESAMGIELSPEVLPLSDLAGLVAPFLASPRALLVRRAGRVEIFDAS